MTLSCILIVEDDAEQGRALKHMLESMGHTVLGPAPDCSSALELIWREKPDLAFVDTYLGSDTCEVVLEECDQQDVPVIVTLAREGELPDFCLEREQLSGPPMASVLQVMLEAPRARA
ncbi:Response regulator receiver domain-containing protein [Devosia crocina]|uniref:Response regulator receiver domain-containing protein n=1 Tax=Devosia crocina TaxID=429728 RepID=A0A1I7N024_9HYPH|nr:response regulator [Devosia crocina]SFV28019.1 Response regulator receiver domain-containing protein [Devosia crocina]